jgi:hypothetical protein
MGINVSDLSDKTVYVCQNNIINRIVGGQLFERRDYAPLTSMFFMNEEYEFFNYLNKAIYKSVTRI